MEKGKDKSKKGKKYSDIMRYEMRLPDYFTD